MRAAAGLAATLALAAAFAATATRAHDGENHAGSAEALAHLLAPEPGSASSGPEAPLPIPLGGAYALTDQHGARRTESDPDGRLQLIFFGYASCQAICATALPRMAEMARLLGEAGVAAAPVMITIDPARDTPEAMAAALPKYGGGLIGLTGAEVDLAAARALFRVEREVAFVDPELGPVYAHGSMIYLMDADGGFLTFIPPILSLERGAEIAARYAGC